ncbi:MAG: LysM peptidoglycan-binding domain-containing protein [Prosthecobacter sp.]
MKSKRSKKDSLIIKLMDVDHHRHRVALVTDEGEWNQHEPNTGMARMFLVMLIIHIALIGGIIVYDFMGEEEVPGQTITQAARTQAPNSGLPQASPEVINAQAKAVANPDHNTEQYAVSSGDSIRSIAEKHGTTEDTIIQMNRLDKGIQIEPGTLLNVPKQAVLSAVPLDRETALSMARHSPPQTQGQIVRPENAPASLAAVTSPISLLAPGEAAPVGGSIGAAAEAPAISAPASDAVPTQQIIGRVNPEAMAALAKATIETEKAIAVVGEALSSPKTESKSAATPKVESKIEPKTQPKKVVAESETQHALKAIPVSMTSQKPRRIDDTPSLSKVSLKKTVKDSSLKTSTTKAASKTHTVASGETLYRLSSKYGVSIEAIQKANHIKNPNAMRQGMKLIIPTH